MLLCRWLGQTSPSRPLQGFQISLRLFRGTSPCPRTTLAGLNGLSERSGLRSGDIGSPLPPRRSKRPRGLPPSDLPFGRETARLLPQASSPSQGSGRNAFSGPARTGSPLLGFPAPTAASAEGSVCPGLASPGTVRPRGFSPPRRVALPPALRTRWVRCRSWGSCSQCSFERIGRGASLHPLRPLVHGAPQPRTLRNTRSASSADSLTLEPVRSGSTAVVPELSSPLRSASFPDRRRGFRPRFSPRALES